MSDLYSELLVKKQQTGKDKAVKFGLIGLSVLLILGGLVWLPLLIAGIVLGIVSYYFIIPKTDLEFEYLFVNGELDVDMIMSKTKRKRVKSIQLSDADIMAPLKSH